MLLFSFLVIPLLLLSFCLYYRNKNVIPVVVLGLVAGILVCAFKTFFLFSHRIIPYSLSDNYIYLLFRQTIIPVVVLYSVFFAFSKDSVAFKINAYFPLQMSFYSVYLPYLIVSSSEGLYSAYSLFLKPFVFSGMILLTAIMVQWAFKTFNSDNSKKICLSVLFILLAVVYMLIPALLEAMYLIKEKVVLVYFCSFIYFLLPYFLIALIELKKIKL